jgi:hypothetical protein
MNQGNRGARRAAAAAVVVVCLALGAGTAHAEEGMEAGVSMGFTLNGDQIVVGGHLERVGGAGVIWGGQVLFGFGDAFATMRASARIGYDLGGTNVAARPTVAISSLLYMPVGRLASFCGNSAIRCWGFEVGPELGGAMRWREHSLEAMVGLSGIPALTVLARTTP